MHTTLLPPVQVPLTQVSVCVHALPSLHAAPSVFAGLVHVPVDGLQTPVWHVSVCVQAFPSLHAVPFGAFGFEQVPVAGSHVPATWHRSLAVHVTGLEPVHVPAWHVSVWVHASPSLHAVPFGALGFEQVPVAESHTPATWH